MARLPFSWPANVICCPSGDHAGARAYSRGRVDADGTGLGIYKDDLIVPARRSDQFPVRGPTTAIGYECPGTEPCGIRAVRIHHEECIARRTHRNTNKRDPPSVWRPDGALVLIGTSSELTLLPRSDGDDKDLIRVELVESNLGAVWGPARAHHCILGREPDATAP